MLKKINYDIVRYAVPNYKLNKNTKVILIADLHGYTNNKFKSSVLANKIKELNPHHIMIAGDNIQGDEWENSSCVRNFQIFLENLREISPVFISLGNHDLHGNNSENHSERIYHFLKLETKDIYPLYKDKVIYDGFEVVGITPSYGLARHCFDYEKDLLHQKYLEEINERIKFDEDYIVEFLGHDPNMILGQNLGLFEKGDFFFVGHLHNGYYPSKLTKRNPDKYLEYGFIEKCLTKDELGNIKSIYPFVLARTSLARGVIYFDNNGDKKYLCLRNGNYYQNINGQWLLCNKNGVLEKKLKALIITGGIRKFSYFSDLVDIPEITEVNYISEKCKIKDKML